MHASFRGACLLLAVALSFAGCRQQEPPVAPARVPTQAAVIDDLGRPWDGHLPARRIVSLAPNVTEIVCAVGGQEYLVGIDTASDYPPAVKRIPQVGEFLRPSIERIVSLRPDAVIVSSATLPAPEADRFAQTLRAPVFVLNPVHLEDVCRNVRIIGQLLGLEQEAEAVAAKTERRLADVARRAGGQPRRRVFLEIWHEPLTTVGGGTFLDDLIRLAGGQNVAASQKKPFPTFSLEALLAANPEVYIVTTGMGAAPDPAKRPGFGALRAVRNRRVVSVPGDPVMRPTPRLAEGAEHLLRAIHPEAQADEAE